MVSIQLLSELFVGSYIFVCLINGIVWFHVYFLCSEINYFWRILCFFGVRDCFFFYFIFYLKVFAHLLVDSQKLLMVTVAAALHEIGYEFQVVSFVCVLLLLRLEYGCEESKQCF